MEQNSLDLILIGKAGTGKSSTANSILNKEAFKRNPRSASFAVISEPRKESCVFKGRNINVVDGLNVGEATSEDCGDVDRDITSLTKAFNLCNDGFSAILIVIQFGVKFGEEEMKAMATVKAILGDSVLRRFGICVITYGDNYQHSLEEEEFKNFDEWQTQQEKGLRNLFKECDNRCVIFNNRSKDPKEIEKQLQTLVDYVTGLSKHGKRRYVEKDLQEARKNHDKLRSERKPVEIEQKVTKVIENVRKRFEDAQTQPSDIRHPMLKSLQDELTELSKHVVETLGDQSNVSIRCAPQIQALYHEIGSQLKSMDYEAKHPQQHHERDVRGQDDNPGQMEHDSRGVDLRGLEGGNSDHKTLLGKQSGKTSVSQAYDEFKSIASRAEEAKKTFGTSIETYSGELGTLIGELSRLRDHVNSRSTEDSSFLQLLSEIARCERELRMTLKSLENERETTAMECEDGALATKFDDDRGQQFLNTSSTAASILKPSTVNEPGKGNMSAVSKSPQAAQKEKTTSTTRADSVDLLLIGRSGNGRSATGNSILGKPAFKVSSSTAASGSGAANIMKETAKFDGLTVNVIDGPGINDSEDTQQEDLEVLVNAVEKSMELCDYGFSALLIVLKFGLRFTKQEVDCIKVIKSVLGKNVIRDYGICVVTHGDNFDREAEDMAEDGEEMDFDSWCKGQESDVRALFEECEFRCVLFDNRTKDMGKKDAERKKLLSLVDMTKKYSKQEFLAAEEGLQELAFETMIPRLEQEAQQLTDHARQKMVDLEREKAGDPKGWKSKMEELLRELRQFKDSVQESSHDSSSVLQITTQLSLLEIEIRSKLDQQRMLDESKSAAAGTGTGSSNLGNRPSFPQGPAGTATRSVATDKNNDLWHTTQNVRRDVKSSMDALDRQTIDEVTYRAEMQALLGKVKSQQLHIESCGMNEESVNQLQIQVAELELEIYQKIKDRQWVEKREWVNLSSNTNELKYPHPSMHYPRSGHPNTTGAGGQRQPPSRGAYHHQSQPQPFFVQTPVQSGDITDLIKKKWKQLKQKVKQGYQFVVHGRTSRPAYRY